MLRINLLPIRQLKKRAKARNEMVGFGMIFVVVLVVMFFIGFVQAGRIALVQSAIADLQREESQLAPIIREVDELERKQEELKRKIGVIKQLQKESSLTVHVLDEVANIVDNERMWLESLAQQEASLQLKGTALDNETIAQFMEALKTSDYITAVSLASSTQKKVGERAFKSFSLSCSVGFPQSKENEK